MNYSAPLGMTAGRGHCERSAAGRSVAIYIQKVKVEVKVKVKVKVKKCLGRWEGTPLPYRRTAIDP